MKQKFLLLTTIWVGLFTHAQKAKTDTSFETRIVSAEWMPDGKSILFAVVKFHKTDRNAPFFSKVFQYQMASGEVIPLFANGGSINPSRDGKSITFMKRDDPKRKDVYVYDLQTKSEKLLRTDTLRKSAMERSPDGTKIAYNISMNGSGASSPVEICVFDFKTRKTNQITNSGSYKSYSPVWSPDSKRIVYYLEKGDGHDQIWLTDSEGSFHRNLTNDTTTHNYFPSWLNEQTIIYTQSPASLMMINIDGSNRQKIEGADITEGKYNSTTKKIVYVLSEEENKLVLFDLANKTTTVILDGKEMITKF